MLEILDFSRHDLRMSAFAFDEDTSCYVDLQDRVEDEFKRVNELRNKIIGSQYNIRGDFFEIAAALYEIKTQRLYYSVCDDVYGSRGYNNFYTFCKDVLGFKKTTVVNLLNVYETFISKQAASAIQVVNFSYSQLVALLQIPEEYRPRIPVQMSVRNIKNLSEYYHENVAGDSAESDLKSYSKWKAKKKDRENAKKNAITFIPSKVIVKDEQNGDELDDEIVSTPTPNVNDSVDETAAINALLRQMAILVQSNARWRDFSEIVCMCLETRNFDLIKRRVGKKNE